MHVQTFLTERVQSPPEITNIGAGVPTAMSTNVKQLRFINPGDNFCDFFFQNGRFYCLLAKDWTCFAEHLTHFPFIRQFGVVDSVLT